MQLTNEFLPIRRWAEERGIYENGDPKTQYIKLIEEVGELGVGILKNDHEGIKDAIGDIVVVLTNLTELLSNEQNMMADSTIEKCINQAYEVIKNRKGSMKNGTFVKEQ